MTHIGQVKLNDNHTNNQLYIAIRLYSRCTFKQQANSGIIQQHNSERK